MKEKTHDRKWRGRSGNRRKEGRKTWAGSIRKAEKRGKRFAQSGAQWGEQASKTVTISTELAASGECVHKENGKGTKRKRKRGAGGEGGQSGALQAWERGGENETVWGGIGENGRGRSALARGEGWGGGTARTGRRTGVTVAFGRGRRAGGSGRRGSGDGRGKSRALFSCFFAFRSCNSFSEMIY